jgi:hypothetical protein
MLQELQNIRVWSYNDRKKSYHSSELELFVGQRGWAGSAWRENYR